MIEPHTTPAILLVDDEPVGVVEVDIEESEGKGIFWPQGNITLGSFPDQRTTLRFSNRPVAIPLKGVRRCSAKALRVHYHFRLTRA
jgi:hypothetical protein